MLLYMLKDPIHKECSALALYALGQLQPLTSCAPVSGVTGSLPQSESGESILKSLFQAFSSLCFPLAHKCF